MSERSNVLNKTISTGVLIVGKTARKISITLSSAALDDGNTPTSTVRMGMPLGRITASGEFKENDATVGDGSETFVGILGEDVDLIDSEENAVSDKQTYMYVSGDLNEDFVSNVADANFSLANAKSAVTGLHWQTPEALYFPGAGS